jgi:hypothetical protein
MLPDVPSFHVLPSHPVFSDEVQPAAFHRCLLRASIDLDLPWRMTIEKLGLGLLKAREAEGSC